MRVVNYILGEFVLQKNVQFVFKLVFITFTLIFTNALIAEPVSPAEQIEQLKSSETYQIGEMVKTLQKALKVRDEQALRTIQLYGTDSRYYPMIRGWLFQELVGVESQLHASKNKKNSERFQLNSDFLKQAIRLIDLE